MGVDNQLKNRVGEVSYTKYSTKATILQYKNNKQVLIEFDDDYHYQYWTSYVRFIKGSIVNPYDKNICSCGFIGSGKYNSKHIAYPTWFNMIKRCYGKIIKSNESYFGCTVTDEWHNFQNFAKWFDEHYYECNETLTIDKDILVKDNKIYSPQTCLLVPKTLNLIFVNLRSRKNNLPTGVSIGRKGNRFKYQVFLSTCADKSTKHNPSIYLGLFNRSDEAFLAYKQAKEQYIKKILSQYENIIPKYIYETIYNYEITTW